MAPFTLAQFDGRTASYIRSVVAGKEYGGT